MSDFRFGSADFSTIYWGKINIKDNNFAEYISRRTIFLYFFDKNQVFYRLGSKEGFGSNSLISMVELDNDKIQISFDCRDSYREWDDYELKFFINEWKIKNDSTLLGKNRLILTKIRKDERCIFDDNITTYEYQNYHLKAYFSREKNKR